METTEKRVMIMLEVENLVTEWNNYIDNIGNECAYTDSILELIKEKVNEL